jgi:L-aminopeptidase/D-esterase-like protein
MAILPQGFRIGHWTDPAARTGCTVILTPPMTVASCDVRGSSPGSRELALLAPDKTMQEVHALVLTGGSAYGLASADGVMRYLEENGIGYQTPWARVPIVPAAVIFDLNIGSSTVRPDADSGRKAAAAATAAGIQEGGVGAGTGAAVGKWAGLEKSMPGGFAFASETAGGAVISAVAVVNAVGDVYDASGNVIAGAHDGEGWLAGRVPVAVPSRRRSPLQSNTTLVAVLTDARLTKVEAHRVAQRLHDGMARAIKPIHTSFDGDVGFCLASGVVDVEFDLVAEAGAAVCASAIRRAVTLTGPERQ